MSGHNAMRTSSRHLLLAAAITLPALALSAQSPATAAPSAPRATPQAVQGDMVPSRSSRLPRTRFVYKAEGKRLVDVLQDFSASVGLPAVVAEGVEGVVTAGFDTSPEVFLDAISRTYGILWYHDGAALYFYPSKAIQTRLFRLKGFRRAQVMDFLHSLDLGDNRFPLKFNEDENTLLASGPPRHIELIASALDSLDIGAAESNQKVARVFPLSFASANDRVLGETTIPGLATVLRNLYTNTGTAAPTANESQSARSAGNRVKSLQSTYGAGRLAEPTAPAREGAASPQDKGGAGGRGLRSPVNFDDDAPSFEADEGTNAVVVHGRAHKMREYEGLVRQLDQKPVLVELEATIIDISADDVRALGVDWSLRAQRDHLTVTSPGNAPPETGAANLLGSGLYTIGTVISNAGREFLMRVNALQGEGKARIVSKPTVLGVANRAAVMREKRVATVRVAGNLEANLFQIEAGTALHVTPQVIASDGGQRIKLSIYIEDGNFESRLVDQVPVLKKTEIRTEAHVREGESLLIGGITVEAEAQQQNGVPLLRSIPVLGHLFKWDGQRAARSERLFLITPRLIDLNRSAQASAAAMAKASNWIVPPPLGFSRMPLPSTP